MSKQTVTPAQRTTGARTVTAAKPANRTTASLSSRKTSAQSAKPFQMPFEQKNILMILAGVGVICLGYFLMWVSPGMSTMALTISPIILLIGYCIVVPLGIMAGSKTFKRQPTTLGGEPTGTTV